MEFFGVNVSFTNGIGFYSFIAVLFLILLYLMRPKPIKKTIPSLIFLEWNSNKKNLAAFFQKFVKDWLFLLQFLIVLLLCLAAIGTVAELYFSKLNNNVAIVIDSSASSKAFYNGKMAFDEYKEIGKKSLGVKNTIIAIKNSPEIVAKETNMLNANRIISSMKPTDSLSNIWDSMMLASQFSENIIVISDFSDTNSKDIAVAKQVIEAKGAKVTLINPRNEKLRNIGLVKYIVSGNKAEIEARNFDDLPASFTVKNTGEKIDMAAYETKQFSVDLNSGVNKVEISEDDFSVDNTLNIIVPSQNSIKALFISSRKNNLYHALSSIRGVELRTAEPPIVPIEDENIIIMSELDYDSLLPGTMEKIQSKVKNGGSLIITAQEGFDDLKFLDMLPVTAEEKEEEITILNNEHEKFKNFDFGLSSTYVKSKLINNKSIVIATYYDGSPAIVYQRYGQGNILYYGIIDNVNSFRLSTGYPLFWISVLDMMVGRKSMKEINLQIGDIIYGETIKTPSGEKKKEFLVTEETGIYETDKGQISVNLFNPAESNLNNPVKLDLEDAFEKKFTKENINILPFLVALAILFLFLEVIIMKRRGDM